MKSFKSIVAVVISLALIFNPLLSYSSHYIAPAGVSDVQAIQNALESDAQTAVVFGLHPFADLGRQSRRALDTATDAVIRFFGFGQPQPHDSELVELSKLTPRELAKLVQRYAKQAALTSIHVFANHVLVSIHAAFLFPYYINVYIIGGILGPLFGMSEFHVGLPNIWIAGLIEFSLAYITWHLGIYHHERGHFLLAVKLSALHATVLSEEFVEKQIKKLKISDQDAQDLRQLVDEKGGGKNPAVDRKITDILTHNGYLTHEDYIKLPLLKRWRWELAQLTIPWGWFDGIVKTPEGEPYEWKSYEGTSSVKKGLNVGKNILMSGLSKVSNFLNADFHPNAPSNLRVDAEGPRVSAIVAKRYFVAALVLLIGGVFLGVQYPALMTATLPAVGVWGLIHAGRLSLGVATVAGVDRWKADPGKLKEYEREQALALQKREEVGKKLGELEPWVKRMVKAKIKMITTRSYEVVTNMADGTVQKLWAPWQYRNCAMGGAHTEAQYPESNISLQESMFIPLKYANYEEFQQMTVNLQKRLQRVIENAEGCRVMGIGLEGGLAPFIKPEKEGEIPEQRLWRMMKQAIEECGYVPGEDVAIAIDGAVSECEKAYKKSKGIPEDSDEGVGNYWLWRFTDREIILNKEQIVEIFRQAIEDDDIPIISIEDGGSETDDSCWAMLMDKFGYEHLHIVMDDNATTNDKIVEEKMDYVRDSGRKGVGNALLVKANQIGTLTETVLAMLVAKAKGAELIPSHRSKSPNDTMEAMIALAIKAMGMKTGGGANTERLVKYGAVLKEMARAIKKAKGVARKKIKNMYSRQEVKDLEGLVEKLIEKVTITDIIAWEDATNAGIPTVRVEISFGIPGSDLEDLWTFEGSTPLGTSAGSTEAIHLVDSVIEPYMLEEVGLEPAQIADLFVHLEEDNTYRFKHDKDMADKVGNINSKKLSEMYERATNYQVVKKIKIEGKTYEYEAGQGCLNAADYANNIFGGAFIGKTFSDLGQSIFEVDKDLLDLEFKEAIKRGKLVDNHAVKEDSPQHIKEHIMQLKGQIGMNSILSQSLAMSRLIAHVQGKRDWEPIREMYVNTAAQAIARYGGTNLFRLIQEHNIQKRDEIMAMESLKNYPDERDAYIAYKTLSNEVLIHIQQAVSQSAQEDVWKTFSKDLELDDLNVVLEVVSNKVNEQGIPTYKILRSVLPVYGEGTEIVEEDPVDPLNFNLARVEMDDAVSIKTEDADHQLPESIALLSKLPKEEQINVVLEAIVQKLGTQFVFDEIHGLRRAQSLLRRAKVLADKTKKTDEINWAILTAAICLHRVYVVEEQGVDIETWAGTIVSHLGVFQPKEIEKIKKVIRIQLLRSHKAETDGDVDIESKILWDIAVWNNSGISGIYRLLDALWRAPEEESKLLSLKGHPDHVLFANSYFKETKELSDSRYKERKMFFEKLREETYKQDELFGATGVSALIKRNLNRNPKVAAQRALRILRSIKAEIEVEQNAETSHDKILSDISFAMVFFHGLEKIYERPVVLNIKHFSKTLFLSHGSTIVEAPIEMPELPAENPGTSS